MAQTGARSVGTHEWNTATGGVDASNDGRHRGMTPAQWFCLLAGATLLLVGLLGFIADASFDVQGTGDGEGGNANGQLQGDSFLGFEVNGWHNVVHILSGLLLLSAFRKRTAAKTIALLFGLIYAAVTIIGLIDGNDVLGLIPVNRADNILHIALTVAAILSSLVSPRDEKLRTSTAPATGTTTSRTVARTETTGRDRRFDRDLDPRDMNPTDRGEQTTNRR